MKNITLSLASASALLLAHNAYAATPNINPEVDASTKITDAVSTPANKPGYSSEPQPWNFDTAVLFYSEKDRVQAVEPVINASKDFGGERVLNLKLVLDGLTGASPNGAAPANVPQTFTGPSGTAGTNGGDDDNEDEDEDEGGGATKTPAGQLPLDSSFKDTRVAVNVGWSQPLSSSVKGSVGANFSKEYDFTSIGANAALSKEFNDKNTTVSAGISYEHDLINPVGGAPVGLTDTADLKKEGNKTKSVAEAMIGVTQLLSPKAYYQLNYSYSSSNGYMTDPYKIVTELDANNELIEKSADTYTYVYEKRPDTRVRHAIFNRVKYKMGTAILDASYRYTTDDWGVKTHTADARVRFEMANNAYYIEPHVRYYTQTAADFYTPYVTQGAVGEFASADSRLGAFKGMTIGGKIGWNLSKNQEINLRVERYTQTPKNVASPTTGALAGQKLQPDLTAYMAQIGYRFKW